jgi:hypothetical protein
VGDVQHRAQVDVDDLGPEIGGRFQEGDEEVPASIVDEDLDRAELDLDPLDGGLTGGQIGQVEGNRHGLAALGADTPGHGLGRGLVDIGHDDLGAVLGETQAGRRPDPPAPAGYDNNFPFRPFKAISPPAWAGAAARNPRQAARKSRPDRPESLPVFWFDGYGRPDFMSTYLHISTGDNRLFAFLTRESNAAIVAR